jgi:serine/threonine protein kinase
VAVKTVKLTDEDEGITSTTIRELTILQNLNHPNIIKFAIPHIDLQTPDC